MRILCTGLNHKTAKLELREKLALDAASSRKALADLAQSWPHAEFLVLSTCNRTELYVARPVHGRPREEQLHLWLARWCGLNLEQFASALYTLADADAMEHLFEVAAGLDSLVPGEDQIVNQIKQAYQFACDGGSAGAVLNAVVQAALRAAKAVRSETGLAQGRVSVASVAIDCLLTSMGSIDSRRVLCLGTGKMGRLVLTHLRDQAAGPILVASRSPERARGLAGDCGGEAIDIGRVDACLSDSDVVICSTAAAAPVLTRRQVEAAVAGRADRPMLILDLAVPRNVEPSAAEVRGVRLINLDDLEQVVRGTIRMRDEHRLAAQRLIRHHVQTLREELSVRIVAPTIRSLYHKMRRIADEELADAANKLASHEDMEQDLQILRRTLHRTIRRMLHPAAVQLRQSAGSSTARADAAALERLFDLEE